MKFQLPETIAARSALVVTAAAALLVVATQVPLAPVDGGLVPIDTWAGTRFPGIRDFYRARLAGLATPGRLILLALCLGLLVAASPLTRSSYHAGDDFRKMQEARAAQLRKARA